MLKVIGHRAELFNEYCKNTPEMEQIPEAIFDTHVVLVGFYTKVIKFFREGPSSRSTLLEIKIVVDSSPL